MKTIHEILKNKALGIALLGTLAVVSAGCSGSSSSSDSAQRAYDAGYTDGFAEDDEYYAGYTDSWITEGAAPIFYRGHEIPFLDELSYDAGFFDGLFDAYNDGYFVAYRYAFIIGFSDGYDAAFAADYLDFLAADVHFEFLHGGFSDGYNDGFSEGRVFGAFDFEVFLPFDWLDAFLDWEAGTDLFFEEVNVGTGEFGPVELYQYGFNPHDIFGRNADRGTIRSYKSMRAEKGKSVNTSTRQFERPLPENLRMELDVAPDSTERTERMLRIEDTWFERIQSYENAVTAKDGTPLKSYVSLRDPSPRAR